MTHIIEDCEIDAAVLRFREIISRPKLPGVQLLTLDQYRKTQSKKIQTRAFKKKTFVKTPIYRTRDWPAMQAAYDSGLTYREVGKKFGIGETSLKQAVRRGDLVSRPCVKVTVSDTNYDWHAVQQGHDDGLTFNQLREKFSISIRALREARRLKLIVSNRDKHKWIKIQQIYDSEPMAMRPFSVRVGINRTSLRKAIQNGFLHI